MTEHNKTLDLDSYVCSTVVWIDVAWVALVLVLGAQN